MTVATLASTVAQTVGGAPAEDALVQGTADWDLHLPATNVDAKDADTPDAWVPRDPRIQRCEAAVGRWHQGTQEVKQQPG
jgi:hypothetical protein